MVVPSMLTPKATSEIMEGSTARLCAELATESSPLADGKGNG